MGQNLRRVSPCRYQTWDTSGHGSLGPHRPFFDWENGRVMCRAVPLPDEKLPDEEEIHPNNCAPLCVVGRCPNDPCPWE